MNITDIITILIFSFGIVVMGLTFSRKGKNMKSFFSAGGSVPWQTSGLSLFMGFFSAGTFVVWGSIAYSMGLVSIAIQWTMAIAGFLVGTFLAPAWHKTGAFTAAEYITNRLGGNTQKVYTYLFLFVSLFTTGSFLYPVAKIIEVSTGFPLNSCILLIGGLCVLYVTVGGLWAVMSTDVLQFVILTVAVLIVIPLSISRASDVYSPELIPEGFLSPVNSEYTWGFILAFGIYNTIFLGGNWAYVQRYTNVKTSKDARKTGWLFGALYVICPVLWMLPPMLYRIINPGLSLTENEGAYLLICKEVLPAGVLGLMLGGMIFATASSLNAFLNISSGVITNDLFRRIYPGSSGKTCMHVARIATFVIGAFTIGIALLVPRMGGIVNVVLSVAALTGVPLYLPVLWTLFSKRQTALSALVTTGTSLCVNAFFKFITPALWGFGLDRTWEMVIGVTVPIALLALFECFYRRLNRTSPRYGEYKKWEKQNKEKKEQLPEEDIRQTAEENRFSRRVIGYGILFTGTGVCLLGIIASYANGLVLAMGILLLTVGYIIKKDKR